MLPLIATIYFTWSILWVVSFLQEFNYFSFQSDLHQRINDAISVYHATTIFLTVLFYYQSIPYKRKHLKIIHYEQKFWLFVGTVAAFANILKNMYSQSLGVDNLIAFVPVTIQNTLVYFASIYCIIILDGWKMENVSKLFKGSVWVLMISQMIINLTLVLEGVNSYLNPPNSGEPLEQLLFLTAYRSWLIYFGLKKTLFLWRKAQRWDCELFTYAVIYKRIKEDPVEPDVEDPQSLQFVSQRFPTCSSFFCPQEIHCRDPSFQLQNPLLHTERE